MGDEEKEGTLEHVKPYNLGEHRDELRRVLAKIIGRRITGKVEVDLSEGTPGGIRSREVVKGTK